MRTHSQRLFKKYFVWRHALRYTVCTFIQHSKLFQKTVNWYLFCTCNFYTNVHFKTNLQMKKIKSCMTFICLFAVCLAYVMLAKKNILFIQWRGFFFLQMCKRRLKVLYHCKNTSTSISLNFVSHNIYLLRELKLKEYVAKESKHIMLINFTITHRQLRRFSDKRPSLAIMKLLWNYLNNLFTFNAVVTPYYSTLVPHRGPEPKVTEICGIPFKLNIYTAEIISTHLGKIFNSCIECISKPVKTGFYGSKLRGTAYEIKKKLRVST